MNGQKQHIAQLFQKYLKGSYSEQELDELLTYFTIEDSGQLESLINQQFESLMPEQVNMSHVDRIVDYNHHAIVRHIVESKPPRRSISGWRTIAAVAAIALLMVGTAWYWYSYRDVGHSYELTSELGEDIVPGGNRAYITFGNGQRLELDSTQSGLISNNGKHVYSNGQELIGSESDFAIVSTPIAGTFQVTLPDGTKVWLNASSSIKYPNVFDSKERIVEITGEVYLEVKSDKDKPFVVHSDGQRIEVLGTAFNIRNYNNYTITTLLNGKISMKIASSDRPYVLNPGDQVSTKSNTVTLEKVNAAESIAWKDGVILNRDATLMETCAELERWYDVKFVFPKDFNNKEIAMNSLNRDEMLSSILIALQHTYKVQFEIKGREVIVK